MRNDALLMVSISCLTYNHENYIRQCLDGFVMQKTNFRFEAIVHDDASTDRTAEIVREYAEKYPDIIKPIFETENQYSKGNGIIEDIMVSNLRGKYVAICEGDDYWIDPLKLQKQFDYMESHPNCSLCFHPDYRLFGDGKMMSHHPRIKRDTYKTKDVILLDGGLMATGSMFFRNVDYICREERPKFWTNSPVGDEPLRLYLSTRGSIGYIDKMMSVYRMSSVGSWTSKNLSIHFWTKHVKSVKQMYSEFDEYTQRNFHYCIIIAKCILGIKYIKGICHAIINRK